MFGPVGLFNLVARTWCTVCRLATLRVCMCVRVLVFNLGFRLGSNKLFDAMLKQP